MLDYAIPSQLQKTQIIQNENLQINVIDLFHTETKDFIIWMGANLDVPLNVIAYLTLGESG